jgi:hypothetical protein
MSGFFFVLFLVREKDSVYTIYVHILSDKIVYQDAQIRYYVDGYDMKIAVLWNVIQCNMVDE